MNIPKIAYWGDTPISELPREELERLFIEAHEQIRALQSEACRRSVAHVGDLAKMRREQVRERHPILEAIFGGR